MTKRESQPGTPPPQQPGKPKIEPNNFKGTKKVETIADLINQMSPKEAPLDTSDLKASISSNIDAAIKGLASENRKERVASLGTLKMMRKDVVDLTQGLGDNGKDMLKSFDEVISQGEKSNSLLKSYLETKDEAAEKPKKGILKGIVDGMYKETSPFLKLGVNLTQEAWGFLKNQGKHAKDVQARSKEALAEIKDSLEEGNKQSSTKPQETPKEAAPQPSKAKLEPVEKSSPEPVSFPTKEPAKIERVEPEAPKVEKVVEEQAVTIVKEEKQSKARKTYEKAQAKAEMVGPVRRRGKDKVQRKKPTKTDNIIKEESENKPVKMDRAEVQAEEPKTTVTEAQTSDAIEKMVKQSSEAQSSALVALKDALTGPEKEKPASTNPDQPDKILGAQLEKLTLVNDQLAQMIDYQKSQAAAQQDQSNSMSREELRKKSLKGAKGGDTDRKGFSTFAEKAGGIASSILGMLMPEMLAGLLGIKAGKLVGGGIFGALSNVVKTVTKGIVSIFKPSTWIAAYEGIMTAFETLKNPKKLLSGVIGFGESIVGAFKTGGVVADKAAEAFKFLSKPLAMASEAFSGIVSMGSKLAGFLPAAGRIAKLAKGIPVIGEIVAVAFAIYDFFSGFINAGDILGKDKELVNIWDRVSAGIGGLIGGLVGIVDSIASLFGFETDMGGKVKKGLATFLSEFPGQVVDFITGAIDSIQGDMVKFGEDLARGIKDFIKGTAKMLLSSLPGGKFVFDKLFPEVKEPKPTKTNDAPSLVDQIPKPERQPNPMLQEKKPKTPIPEVAPKPRVSTSFKQLDEKNQDDISRIEAEKKQAASMKVSQVNNVDNSNKTSVYNSTPLTTRNPDDSHRRGL